MICKRRTIDLFIITFILISIMRNMRALNWQQLAEKWMIDNTTTTTTTTTTTIDTSSLTLCEYNNEHSYLNTIDFLSIKMITCPKLKPKISLKIHPFQFLQIQCFNINEDGSNSNPFDLLPKLNLNQHYHLIINNCTFTTTTSITHIMQHLGIKNLNYLEINNDLNDMRADAFKTLFRNASFNDSDNNELKILKIRMPLQKYLPIEMFLSHQLKNLMELDLHLNPPMKLTKNVFENFPQLKILRLQTTSPPMNNNNENTNKTIHSLPVNLLESIQQLQQLQLQLNYLNDLNVHFFVGAFSTTLKILTISSTNLQKLPANVFDNLSHLELVHISNNRLNELPMNLFKYNHNLNDIKLKEKHLEQIPDDLCKNLNHLERVHIEIEMKMIPENVFYNSTNILYINLSRNRLNILPENLLNSQINLIEIDFSFNSLTDLPDKLFEQTKRLKRIKLNDNLIRKLNKNIFNSLKDLKYLTMENNHLIDIDMNCFSSCINLHYINMANNQLSFTKPNFSKLYHTEGIDMFSPFALNKNMKTLILRNNSINFIFSDWRYFHSHLHVLDLSYNKLEYLNTKSIQFNQNNIRYINLSHNSLYHLNFTNIELLNLKEFMYLDLNENPIHCDGGLLKFLEFYRKELGGNVSAKLQVKTDTLKCHEPSSLRNTLIHDLRKDELLNRIMSVDCPSGCACWERVYDTALLIDCSHNYLYKLPKLSAWESSKYKVIELNLDRNFIKNIDNLNRLPFYKFVTKLNLANNNVTHIDRNIIPKQMGYIDLRNNSLRNLNDTNLIYLNSLTSLKIYLSGNPWQCDCKAKQWLQLKPQNILIADLEIITCSQNGQIIKLFDIAECSTDIINNAIVAVILALIICLIILIIALIYYIYQQEIKIWLYAQNVCLWFVAEEELDKDKMYDAFISYSHKDEDFINDYLMPNLEGGPNPFKLCIHTRDFIVGGYIPEQIILSVENSRRTVIVLSENFIESVWARMEFRAAHQAALNEGRARIIVIIYGNIGDTENLDTELKTYLKMNTYLKWGDPWFWNKLRYAMPHRSKSIKTKKTPEISMELNEIRMNASNSDIFIRY